MAGRTRGKTENVGVAALARATGYTSAYVSQCLTAGQTADQIKLRALARGKEPLKPGEKKPVRMPGYHPDTHLPALPKIRPVLTAHTPSTPTPTGTVTTPEPNVGSMTQEELVVAAEDQRSATLRKTLADARRLELANMETEGRLIPRDYVEAIGTRVIQEFVDIGMGIPGQIRDELAASAGDPVRCEEIVRREWERLLGRLEGLRKAWGGERDNAQAAA